MPVTGFTGVDADEPASVDATDGGGGKSPLDTSIKTACRMGVAEPVWISSLAEQSTTAGGAGESTNGGESPETDRAAPAAAESTTRAG